MPFPKWSPCAVYIVTTVTISLLLGTIADATTQLSSSTSVTKDPVSEYKVIKALVVSHLQKVDYGSRSEGNQYNLASCGDMELILGLDPEGNAETDALMRIAGYQYTWVTELPEFGYPPEVVGPLVRDAETKLLAHVVSHRGYDSLTDGFYSALQSQADALAAKLSEYKSKQNLNAAKAEFMDECGGGGTLITFKIPKEAKMFIIPPLYMKYCQNQGIDPSDRSACDRYREIFDGAHQMLSGLYYYVAEWPDGHTRKGQFDSSGMPEVFHLSR